MTPMSFGGILQNERERKGLDIPSVARRLRIRPDILQAIEASDFSHMPPRGYARNMIYAYARYLDLNPTEITRLYLDEAYADQVQKARSNAQPTGFDMSGAPGGRRATSSHRDSEHVERNTLSSGRRTLYVDTPSNRYSNASEGERLYSEERTHRSTRSALPESQYTNFYAGPKAGGGLQSKLPLIIAAGVIIVLLIILLVFLFGPKGDPDSDTQNVPVTGVDDTTQTPTGEPEVDSQPVAVAPTQVVVEWEVADQQSAYIEVYENGTVVLATTIDGPDKKGYNVTGALRIDTTNPDAVTVLQDGVEVALTDDNGDSVYSITVDFPSILAQWYVDHPVTTPNASGDAAATN